MPERAGELLLAGLDGVAARPEGFTGAVESSTYMTYALEQPETLPAASAAVALKVVDVSSETETVSPGEEKLAALPVAVGAPVQAAVA